MDIYILKDMLILNNCFVCVCVSHRLLLKTVLLIAYLFIGNKLISFLSVVVISAPVCLLNVQQSKIENNAPVRSNKHISFDTFASSHFNGNNQSMLQCT